MKPLGKTYLIEVKKKKDNVQLVNGIYIPVDESIDDIYYDGYIVQHGTGFTDKDQIIPNGTHIYFDYSLDKKNKFGLKLTFKTKVFYIHQADKILAIINDDQESQK